MSNTYATKQLIDALRQEFQNRCAYCGTVLAADDGTPEHYYPKGKFPALALDPNNIFLACRTCNVHKGSAFPVDASGQPLLLHPRLDNLSEHIKIDHDGQAIPLTERGRATIESLALNRQPLVARRKAEQIADEYFREYDKNRPNAFSVLKMSISIVKSLNTRTESSPNVLAQRSVFSETEGRYLRNMLYANAIGALEAYLSDTMFSTVMRNETSLRRFVENFLDFKKPKFELREIYEVHENIREKASAAMREIIYHDLPKINGIYGDCLGIAFPDFGDLMKAILVRHDIVHRNGKTKDGVVLNIESAELEALCTGVEAFVTDVETKLRAAGG